MDKSISDADFDSYWLDESRNKNRNRIRVGRQYQATVPALLKPGETDGRRCEDLETLKWKPDYEISEEQLDHYLSVAKAVSLFARAINVYQKADAPRCLQSALRGLSEFVTSHHPCHHDAGCKVPNESSSSMSASASLQSVASSLVPLNSDSKAGSASSSLVLGNLGRCEWTPQEADLFAKALEVCGKNFGAIKKEFLPWKPVKSIIEFYYCGKGDIKPSGDSKSPPPSNSESDQQASASTKTECKSDSPTSSPNPSQSRGASEPSVNNAVPEKDDKAEKLFAPEEKKCNLSEINFTVPKAENIESMVPPPSNHPSRAAATSPIKGEVKTSASDDQSGSTVGSLKFYLGGQLVLKLNAQQEANSRKEGGPKCQWVQSVDTPKLVPQSKRQKHCKKGLETKKDTEGNQAGEAPVGNLEGSSSPSDRDGTDSERSRTPEVFQAKKAKIKCYPTSSSASSIASCSSMPRLSPKPPWTPPVEVLKWDKSPGSHQSDEGFAEGSSPKVKQETQGRSKTDISLASPVSLNQTMSPDSGYSYMLPKTKAFGKSNDLMATGSAGIIVAQKCSGFVDNDIRNYNRGSKLQAVLLNKDPREVSALGQKSLWQAGRSSPMTHFPVVSSPLSFSRAVDEVPLDLSKKVLPSFNNSPGKSGDAMSENRSSMNTSPFTSLASRQQGTAGNYRTCSTFFGSHLSSTTNCSTSGQPSPSLDECRGNGSMSAPYESSDVRNGKELSVQPTDDTNIGIGRKKSKKISTSAER